MCDKGAFFQYLTDDRCRQAGCIAVGMQRDFHQGLLGQRFAWLDVGVRDLWAATDAAPWT